MIKNKNIVVTGAGGFIGSHLAKTLKEHGNFVRVADIKESPWMKNYFDEFYKADLRLLENCKSVVHKMDYVFNLAANMGGIGYITQVGADILHDNVLINVHMLEAAASERIDKYFFSSSACVYPNYKQTEEFVPGLKELDAEPADPNEYYGWEKLFSEKMCLAYREDYGLKTTMARFHNVYGPYGTYEGGKEKAPAALCRKISLAKDGDSIIIWGDGKQSRSFLYIDDCVKGVIMLLEKDYPDPLNIGSDRLVSINELVDIIEKISSKKLKREYDLTKPQGVRGRNSDNTLVTKVLKWEPKVSLEIGLEKTYVWIKNELRRNGRL